MKKRILLPIFLLASVVLTAQSSAQSSGTVYCDSSEFDVSFTYTVDSNNTVQFTNTSKPLNAYTYSWNFAASWYADTNTHTSYAFPSAYAYSVKLTAKDSNNKTCTLIDTISVNKCYFNLYDTRLLDGYVKFNVGYHGSNVDSIDWNWGDGIQTNNYKHLRWNYYSTTHQYMDTGNYQAIVSITDVLKNTCKDTLNLSFPCFASFDYVLDSSNTISLINTSKADSNSIYIWDYLFNPNPADSTFNASFQLSEPMAHISPIFTINSPSGSCQVIDTISVNAVRMDWKIDQNKLKMTAKSYSTKIDTLSANFGDGKSSSVFQKENGSIFKSTNLYHYSHQYDTSGAYDIKSTFTNEFGVTFHDTTRVEIQDCFAGFTKALDSTKTKVILANTSSAEAGSIYDYYFGDGTSKYNQTSKAISHTYAEYGTYEVCVTVQNYTNGQRCYSTFCDSVGLDSLGNLKSYGIGKNKGFTINFVDSAAVLVGVEELSIAETKQLSEISIYPNPSHSIFNVNLMGVETAVDIMLFNSLGEVVFHKKHNANQEIQLDLDNYKTGFYYLSISNQQERITKKLLKF